MNPFIVSLLFALLFLIPVQAMDRADENRLDEVAERGKHVMPFDLKKTTHIFSKTINGGIQQIIANDKSDSEQIQLIRDHLSKISQEFRQGDYSGPSHIHGEDMPGLTELMAADPNQIKIEYVTLPDGAQINYTTQSPQLISAIHQWFDAQLSDHARHAVPGHTHRHMHEK